MSIRTFSAAAMAGLAAQIPAQTEAPWAAALQAEFDATVPEALSREAIPGAVILVGHREGGEWRTWCGSFGTMSFEEDAPPMPEDAIFDMASVTKPVATGTALMILADEGLVDVDAPVSTYLSEYDTDEKAEVTVRDLMTHCSGLQSYVGPDDRGEVEAEWGYPAQEGIRDHILNVHLRHAPPRSESVYSCLNAITTAVLVERISGQPFDEFTHDHIFEPLGMVDSGFNPPVSDRIAPTTHDPRHEGEWLVGEVHDPLANMQAGVSGNAGLFSTAQDLSIFCQMMLDGGEANGVRILSEEAVARMTSDQLNGEVVTESGRPVRRGLLWQVYRPDGGDQGIETVPAYGHTGYTGTALRLWPSEGMYVIALTNRVHPDDTGRVTAFRRLCWRTAGDVVAGLDQSVMVFKGTEFFSDALGG